MSDPDFDFDLIDVSQLDDVYFLYPEMVYQRLEIEQRIRDNDALCEEEEYALRRDRTPKAPRCRPLMNTVSRTATITKKRPEMCYSLDQSYEHPSNATYDKISPINYSNRLSTQTFTVSPMNGSSRLSTKTYTVSPPRLSAAQSIQSISMSPPMSRCASLSDCSESWAAPVTSSSSITTTGSTGLRMNLNGRLPSAIGPNGSQTISRGKIMAPSKYIPSSVIVSQMQQPPPAQMQHTAMLPPQQLPSGMAAPSSGLPRKTPRAANLIRPKPVGLAGGPSRIGSCLPLVHTNGH